jgi:enterochelin esterase-like enzyme
VADRKSIPFGQGLRVALGISLVLMACAPAYASAPWRPTADLPWWMCRETSGQIVVMTIPSTAYGQPVAASVYLPPCYDWTPGSLPVVYLLHGGGTDQTQWPDLNVQTEADALIAQGAPPFLVIMPGGSYRVDVDYETFVLNDLIPVVEGQLRVRRDGGGRAIGGISLGGYWALKTAFQYPGLFAAAGGHSPVVTRDGLDDPATLALTAEDLDRLSISLDVGQFDSLRASTEQLAAELQGRGLFPALTVSPGSHNRPYWRAHTGDYLRFYLSAMAPSLDGRVGPNRSTSRHAACRQPRSGGRPTTSELVAVVAARDDN